MKAVPGLLRPAAAALLLAATCASAKGPVTADALTLNLLRASEFEQISISPNGELLAIARNSGGKTMVTLHKREDMAPVIAFDPGSKGSISDLYWIDDKRLLLGAQAIRGSDGFAAFDPTLMIVNVDGSDPFMLPGNFLATIDGDPDHVLIETCGFETTTAGCNVPEIRKNNVRKLVKKGELVSSGPPDTVLVADAQGHARFALGWEDDDTGRTHVYDQAKGAWTLLNDGSKTGLEVIPLSVSADGKYGLLQSERKQGTDVIERYEFATGIRTPLLTDQKSDPLVLAYSVDGKRVIGAAYDPTQPRLRFWDPNDADTKLAMDLQAAFPGKLAFATSASLDGNYAVVTVYSDRDPGTFYLFDRKRMKANIIARRKPWIVVNQQAAQRGFEFKARDGQVIHGLLTLPPNSTGKGLPMVVLPHGGPFGVTEVWGFDEETQILAQHGYAVLQVNFRGSGGYGREFMNKGVRQWGRAMQDDVTDATHWAIQQGVADGKRVCIYGASYGGYSALMGAIREPGLYRCAVGRSGVFDLSKMYKWGSIRRSDYGMRYLKRVIGEDQEELAANSPSHLADKITVPVLLVHGAMDARVDVKHAKLMAKELSKRNSPVDLVEYSATGHYLVLDRHLRDFYARLLAFLGENTK